VFTARYALSPYIKQICFVFKGLICVVPSVRYMIFWIYVIFLSLQVCVRVCDRIDFYIFSQNFCASARLVWDFHNFLWSFPWILGQYFVFQSFYSWQILDSTLILVMTTSCHILFNFLFCSLKIIQWAIFWLADGMLNKLQKMWFPWVSSGLNITTVTCVIFTMCHPSNLSNNNYSKNNDFCKWLAEIKVWVKVQTGLQNHWMRRSFVIKYSQLFELGSWCVTQPEIKVWLPQTSYSSHCANKMVLSTVIYRTGCQSTGPYLISVRICRGLRWCSWLGHCTTNCVVAGLIPDWVIRIFHWHNPFGRTVALGSTQPPTEMSTRNIFAWGGGGG
jgi:hypothetical protein